MGSMAAKAGAMHEMGIPGASMLSRFAGPAGAVLAGLDAGVSAHNTMSNPFLTAAQKNREFARSLPLGETVMGAIDSFNAREHDIGMVKKGLSLNQADYNRDSLLQNHYASFDPQQAHRESLAHSYAGSSAVTAGVFDRSTVAGQNAAGDAQRMLPYRQASLKAEREMAAAAQKRFHTEIQLNKLNDRGNQLLGERSRIQAEIEKHESGPERFAAVGLSNLNIAALKENNEKQRAVRGELEAARGDEFRATGEHAKAKIREDKLGQAGVLDARADRMESSAMRLGGMSPADRAMGAQAIKMMEENPGSFDQIDDGIKSLARNFDPEAFNKLQLAKGVEESKKVNRENFGEDPNVLRAQADTLRGEGAEGEHRADAETAAAVAAEGAKLGAFIVASIAQFGDRLRKEIEDKLLLATAAR